MKPCFGMWRALLAACPPRDRTTVLELIRAAARRGGALSQRDGEYLAAALELGELRLRNAMVPRVDIVAVPEACPVDVAARRMAEHGRHRLVVYRGSLDQPVGILHGLDVALALARHRRGRRSPTAGDLAMPPLTLSEALPLPEALEAMRQQGRHLVLVADSYGGLAGLATLEDILEHLVGPMPDELGHEGRRAISVVGPGEAVVGAAAEVHDVARLLGTRVPDGRFVSIGGLVYDRLGRVPAPGDAVVLPGLRIDVLSTDGTRLRQLRVRAGPAANIVGRPAPAATAAPPAPAAHQRLELRIGSNVVCGTEVLGRLERVVVDPVAGRISHLVVERGHLRHRSALVPVESVEREEGNTIVLRPSTCTPERLATYDASAHTSPAQGWRSATRAYAPGEAVFALGGRAEALRMLPSARQGNTQAGAAGPAVELSRRTQVVCDDGPVGHVDLVLLDHASGAVTHVVVRRGLGHFLAPQDIVLPLSWARRVTAERIDFALSQADLRGVPEYRTDAEVAGDVLQVLHDDERFQGIDFYTVHVEVDEGVVHLTGHVRSAELKRAAEELAGSVRGVLALDNLLVADDELAAEVAGRLREDRRLRVADLEVVSLLGGVELRGRAATPEDRDEAACVARRVPGVRAVANQLVVAPAAAPDRSSDRDEQA